MICIHHNKDMDGYCSGAVVKYMFPDCQLIGWDYKDDIPDFEQFTGEDVVMIDITFPIDKMNELGRISRLTVLDHHISFLRQIIRPEENADTIEYTNRVVNNLFRYVYEKDTAACEIGWKFLFPDKPVPYAVTLIGRYDTWRQNEGYWVGETLPFKYYMYGQCNSTETFPRGLFKWNRQDIDDAISTGRGIMDYQEMMDASAARSYAFEIEAYGARALAMNQAYFNSESLKTVYNPEIHDIMIGFVYTGTKWSVSLRSAKPEFDVSAIAKERGGGGHKGAAGFEVKEFNDIFK